MKQISIAALVALIIGCSVLLIISLTTQGQEEISSPPPEPKPFTLNSTGQGDARVQSQIRLKALAMLNELLVDQEHLASLRIQNMDQYISQKNETQAYGQSKTQIPDHEASLTYNEAVQASIDAIIGDSEAVARAIEFSANLPEDKILADIRAYNQINRPIWDQFRKLRSQSAHMQAYLRQSNQFTSYIDWSKKRSVQNAMPAQTPENTAPNMPMTQNESEEMRASELRTKHIEQERQARLKNLRKQLQTREQVKAAHLNASPSPLTNTNQDNFNTWSDQYPDVERTQAAPAPYTPIMQRQHAPSMHPQPKQSSDQNASPSPDIFDPQPPQPPTPSPFPPNPTPEENTNH